MRGLLLLLSTLALSACVSTQPASVATPEGRASLNERADRGHPVLALWGERGRQVRDLRIDADSARWVDKKTEEARSAPTDQIEAITFRRDGRGALKGMAVGAGLGALLGLYLDVQAAGATGFIDFPPGFWTLGTAVGFAPFGAMGGAIHSDRDVHRIVPPGITPKAGVSTEAASRHALSDEAPPRCVVPMVCAASAIDAGFLTRDTDSAP
ncbi:MAG: hypothetical protein AAF791_12150 [Bacteroidota bacterium]